MSQMFLGGAKCALRIRRGAQVDQRPRVRLRALPSAVAAVDSDANRSIGQHALAESRQESARQLRKQIGGGGHLGRTPLSLAATALLCHRLHTHSGPFAPPLVSPQQNRCSLRVWTVRTSCAQAPTGRCTLWRCRVWHSPTRAPIAVRRANRTARCRPSAARPSSL